MVKKTTFGVDRDVLHTVTGIGQIPAGMIKGGVGAGVSGGITAIGSFAEADDDRDMVASHASSLEMTVGELARYSSTVADALVNANVKPGSSVAQAMTDVGLNTGGAALASAAGAAITGGELGGLPGLAVGGIGGLATAFLVGGVAKNTIAGLFGEKPDAVASVQAAQEAKKNLMPSRDGQPPKGVTSGDVLSIVSNKLSDAERGSITELVKTYGDISKVAPRSGFDSDVLRAKAQLIFGADYIAQVMTENPMTSSELLAKAINQGMFPPELLLVDNTKLPRAMAMLWQKTKIASADPLASMGYSGTGNPLADMGYNGPDNGGPLPCPNVPQGMQNKRNTSLV